MKFTVYGNPVGKPRMTQRDKWQQRHRVVRYRAWADAVRLAASLSSEKVPNEPVSVFARAYLPIPKSATKRREQELKGQNHRQKPDADNILKALTDSLFKRDEGICEMHIQKFWDDGAGPRVEIEVF
jgi:Holliday junction resolvase RusA-like endonuclease